MPKEFDILLGHGGGGRLTQQLLDELILPELENKSLSQRHDGGIVEIEGSSTVMTTDSYVVQPWRFPGGNIGSLSVHGTLNDLAMCGARPVALSCGLIIEEGFSSEDLRLVMRSMSRAANELGVPVVTGDTKVVDHGKGDGIYINTTGVGTVVPSVMPEPQQIEVGDVIIVSGDLGRHGMSVLMKREGFEFESELESDSMALWPSVKAILETDVAVHCMRDLTRGGLGTNLIELAQTAKKSFLIQEAKVAVSKEVHASCELLGLDPFYVACEGRFVSFVKPTEVDTVLGSLRTTQPELDCRVVGEVQAGGGSQVHLQTELGTSRVMDMFSGEQLPRIC